MKVAYVFIGILANSSRALKQINLLRAEGKKVDVYVGNENNIVQEYKNFNFEVYEFSIIHGGFFKIKSFLNPLNFCYKVSRIISKCNYDFVICQELTTLPVGYFLKKNNKDISIIFDNNELSVERYYGLKKYIWSYIQKWMIPYTDVIVHAEKNRLEYFIKKHSLDRNSQKLVCNYPTENKRQISKNNKIVRAIYFGVIHPDRQIEELINVFSNLNENLILDLVGPGEQKYLDFISSKIKDTDNINLLPSVPQSEINILLSNYNIGIAFYANTNLNNYFCAPNKIFQYINNGLAILTNNYPGLLEVVKNNNIGSCIDRLNVENISNGINEIITKKLYLNITDNIRKKYQWTSQKKEFLSIFN